MDNQDQAEQQSKREIFDQKIPQEARFTSLLASACMHAVHDQWLGIVLYFEKFVENAHELAQRAQNLECYAKYALRMAFITALLTQTPTSEQSSHPQMQTYEPQNKVELVVEPNNKDLRPIPFKLSTAEPIHDIPFQVATAEPIHDIPFQVATAEPIGEEHTRTTSKEGGATKINGREHIGTLNGEGRTGTTSTVEIPEEDLEDGMTQADEVPPQSRLDLLKTDEAYIKYGEYALSGPTLIHPDVVLATVREYRGGDEYADEIAHWVNVYAQQYGMNTEVVMTAFMIQEGSFGKVTGNKSGDYNIGNIRSARTGKFLDFESYQQGVEAIFWQVHRYDKVWPTEKNDDTIHELGRALEVYAPPHENPTQERITIAKEFIDRIRLISDQYGKGEISQDQLREKIHELRARLQEKYGPTWI